MFANVLYQDAEIRKLFYDKIRETVEKKRIEMQNKIDEEVPSFISWAMKPLANIAFDMDKAKKDKRGEQGEEGVQNALWLLLPKDYYVINDVVLEPKPDEFIQIDHLVVCKKGIFIIETKNWSGAYSGYRDKWKTRKGSGWIECKSPTKQNLRHKILFESWLEDNVSACNQAKKHIYPLVVIKKAKWLKADNCCMPVLLGGMDAVSYIKSFEDNNLDEGTVTETFLKICRSKPLNHEDWENKHKREVNNVDNNKKKVNYTTGKTKAGLEFVRVNGSKDDAQIIAEDYSKKGYTIDEIKEDRKQADVWYFYLGSNKNVDHKTDTYENLDNQQQEQTEPKELKNKYQVTEGKTKAGKSFVRLKGTRENAEEVAEEYKMKGFIIDEIKQDIKDKDVWYFYLTEQKINPEESKDIVVYNKLVRDRIPDIIKNSGKNCEIKILNNDEYNMELDKKLFEELEEYNKSQSIEELADLVEVIYAIVENKGTNIERFEEIRQVKKNERGGFRDKILLVSTD